MTALNEQQYRQLYQQSIEDPDAFWAEQASNFITWFAPWKKVHCGSFIDLNMGWFIGSKLNACYNCVDRHLRKRSNQVAIIWQGDEPDDSKTITYAKLYDLVCKFANVLKKYGVTKGDRVCIYLPMIPEIAIAMLACARIGAIHTVVFSAFATDALKTRILDANCQLVITADAGRRGGKINLLKQNIDRALLDCPIVTKVVVVKSVGNTIPWQQGRDIWFHKEMEKIDAQCAPAIMDAEDPLFILYTSGSTGIPKGIVHATAGYLVYVAMTYKYVFNYQNNDIFWCTADLGWITGHSYLIYGPLANGATTVMFEGAPHYPSFSRYWEIIDKYQVNIFYTAPTAIRALRKEGDQWVKPTSRKSLKLLGTVGEPINPDVWEWYYIIVGEQRCPIVDTWWQTETGGILITSFPGAMPLKPGAAGWPFFGIKPEIVDHEGNPIKENKIGSLVLNGAWPSLMQTVYTDERRFADLYFKEIPGKYMTGDAALRDLDGYFWIKGRSDDVIKVAGHRLSSAELESALVLHPAIAEAAVVAIPDEIKGHAICAFVVTKSNIDATEKLKKELIQKVRDEIGPIATPAQIHFKHDLPKTSSGKIMRRILRKIASGQDEDLRAVQSKSPGQY